MPASKNREVFHCATITSCLMKKLIHNAFGIFLALVSFGAQANDSTGILLKLTKQRLNDNNLVVTLKAIIPGDTKLYALQSAENNILFSTIAFDTTFLKHLEGDVEEKGSKHSEKDTSVNATVNYYS